MSEKLPYRLGVEYRNEANDVDRLKEVNNLKDEPQISKHKNAVLTSIKTHHITVTNVSILIIFRKIVALCFENRMKLMN
jgi:hypothetical protein